MGDTGRPREGLFLPGDAMRRVLGVIGVALLAAAPPKHDADADPEPPGAGAIRALQGRWDVVRAVIDGKDAELPPGRVYEFSGRRLTKPSSRNGTAYAVKAVGGRGPWRMTLAPQGRGPALGAIFKVEKGELFLCINQGGAKPPEDFSGSDSPVLVLTRQK
jgi:uncharacterized protein (TIGR03067 family)